MDDEFLMLDDRELEPAGRRQAHSSSQAVAVGLVTGHVRGEVGLRDGWRRNGNWRRLSGQWEGSPKCALSSSASICETRGALPQESLPVMPKNSCLRRVLREEWLSCQAFPAFRASETWRVVPDPDRPQGIELSSPPGRVERNNRRPWRESQCRVETSFPRHRLANTGSRR